MVKIKLAIAFLMLLALNTNAQLSTFDLSDYKVPDYKLYALYGDFNMSGYYKTDLKYDNNEQKSRKNFNAYASILLNFEQNSRKIQSGYSAHLSLNPTYLADYIDKELVSKHTDLETNLMLDGYIRKYYKPNKFFEISGFNNMKDVHFKQVDDLTTNGQNFSNSLSIDLLHGHGRIENVTQAWKAYRMIEDIQNRGLENDRLSESDLVQLADLLTSRLKTRWFDYRHKRIEDIELIAAFLKDKGLEDNASLLTSIYDNFDYGINTSRYSGSRFSYGINIGNDHFVGHTEIIDYKDNISNAAVLIDYVYQKPINLDWQFNVGGGLELGVKYLYNKLTDSQDYMRFNFNAGLGYSPSSRSYFNSSLTSSFYIFDEINPDYIEQFNFSWNNNFYYYLSPQLRLEGSFRARRIEYATNPGIVNLNFGLGIGYTFF